MWCGCQECEDKIKEQFAATLSVLLSVLSSCTVAVSFCVPAADALLFSPLLPPQAVRDAVIPTTSIAAHIFLFHLLIVIAYSSDPLFSNRNHLKSKLHRAATTAKPAGKSSCPLCSTPWCTSLIEPNGGGKHMEMQYFKEYSPALKCPIFQRFV